MIALRLAGPDDFDGIWPLLRDVFRAGDTYAIDPNITRDRALDYWASDVRAAYVAVSEDGIVGTYYIRTNQSGGGAHICNCGYIVSSAVRGQGIAAQMCIHSQKSRRRAGLPRNAVQPCITKQHGRCASVAQIGV